MEESLAARLTEVEKKTQLFSSAADARKRPAKCAIAHEPTDDKADVVLLDSCEKLANVYQQFRGLSSFSVTAKKREDAENQEYWYVTGWFSIFAVATKQGVI